MHFPVFLVLFCNLVSLTKQPMPSMQAALKRYQTACGNAPERLVSGSDDFTMFLWEPSVSKKPLQRLTGHMQLINQVS